MISRRSFLIGINTLALASSAFGVTIAQPVIRSGAVPQALDPMTELPLPAAQACTQFKVFGWNASLSDETDPNTTVIYVSSLWRSGWM